MIKVENRSKVLTVRVMPELYVKVQDKLEEEYREKLKTAKNKKQVTKTSISDILEKALVNMVD